MGFLRHIAACNRHDLRNFVVFRVDGTLVGWLKYEFASHLAQWPDIFQVGDEAVDLLLPDADMEARSTRVAEVLQELVLQGVITHLHGEQYVATPSTREHGLLWLDRAAAPYFGIRAFGQHMNGYVVDDGELKLWLGRRSDDRVHFPGKLDNIVAGGLPANIGLQENLLKECWEEAGIDSRLAAAARPVGAITYNMETAKGLKPDTLYCYDLQLPASFRPNCKDGEVAGFELLSVGDVMEIVRDSDEFKLNCNLVVIDFFIRHGELGPDNEEYCEIISGLHPALVV
jgi:8-oxo-dGTP pyrophosphatase MutT (NUDIX family)